MVLGSILSVTKKKKIVADRKWAFLIKKIQLISSVQKIQDEKLKVTFTIGRSVQKWYFDFMKSYSILSLKNTESLEKYRSQVTVEYIRCWYKDLKTFLNDSNATDILDDSSLISILMTVVLLYTQIYYKL